MALNFNAIQRAAAFAPATAFPLDARSYFESYDLAVAAAATAAEPGTDAASNTVYYFGETLVVNEGGKATLYIIQPNGTLKEVGSVPVGDGKSIEVVNGQIKLKGFGTGYYQYNTNYVPGSIEEDTKDQYIFVEEGFKAGLQPQVVAKASGDGFEIAWYEPNPTTVEGLQSQITALDGSVNNLASKVDTKADASDVAANTSAIASNAKAISDNKLAADTVASRVSVAEEKISTIESTYATTSALNSAIEGVVTGLSVYETIENVNAKVSTINNAISSVDAKFSGYYTKNEIDGKVSTINDEISGIVEDLENYAKISYVDAEISKVVEVAQGKTQTFVVNYADNAFLNSQDAELNVQQFTTIDGKAISAGNLKAGDVILVVETDVPDRWVKQVNDQGDFVLAKLETTKVDLAPYATTSYVDEVKDGISTELLNYISGSISTTDTLVLVAGNNQIKETEYTIRNSFTTGSSTTIPTTKAVFDSIAHEISIEASARVSKDNELDAAIKAEVSRATDVEASLRTDVDHLLSQAVLSVSGTDNMHLSIDGNTLIASVNVSGLVIDQGNLVSWANTVDSTLSNHESRISALEAKPFDTYASISYVESEVSKLDAAIKAETSRATGAEASLATRLELVEDSLGLGGEGNHGGVAEQIATIIGEVWGANASAENLAEASSRIDNHEGRIESIEDKVANTLATKEYVGEQIQSAEHVVSVKTDDTDFFEITKDQDDIVTINVKDDIENIIADAATSVVSVGQYVSATISSHGLNINDSVLVSAIDGLVSQIDSNASAIGSIDNRVVALESNAVLTVSGGHGIQVDKEGSYLHVSAVVTAWLSELNHYYVPVKDIASNATYLLASAGLVSNTIELAQNLTVSTGEINTAASFVRTLASNDVDAGVVVSAINWIDYNMNVVSNLSANAITSVQTSTLVVSHVGNNLAINLPSEIWLDGGNAAGGYEAEEAVYNELLNNEYGN